MKLIFIISV